MRVNMMLVWQNWHEKLTDAEVYREEIALGLRADTLGFDSLWSAEHHFTDYAMCPDNMQVLSYFAGRTERIQLGTGAVILPWWPQPVRVAEKLALLDHLSNGRLLIGFGRGLAPMEYERFQIDQGESRQRFDEAAEFVLQTLESGIAEFDGTYYQQPRAEIRPAPAERDWRGLLHSVAGTHDSMVTAAELGATLMGFVKGPIENEAPLIEEWRSRFRASHPDREPGAPVLVDFTYCHRDAEEAEGVVRTYLRTYFLSIMKHYDFAGSHWRDTKGYEAYQAGADMIREAGMEKAVEGYVGSQIWGTPDQIIERVRERVEVIGEYQPTMCFSFAGMPFDMVNDSLTLFAEEVLPELQRMGVSASVSGA
jgi:alkanesulfonate monooxygenase SsuD/methylene tetrahydromethanopterin reductase-like flavin-dependent oxidoreductase (luciferase family)